MRTNELRQGVVRSGGRDERGEDGEDGLHGDGAVGRGEDGCGSGETRESEQLVSRAPAFKYGATQARSLRCLYSERTVRGHAQLPHAERAGEIRRYTANLIARDGLERLHQRQRTEEASVRVRVVCEASHTETATPSLRLHLRKLGQVLGQFASYLACCSGRFWPQLEL
jgi:hypothetical protein